MARAKQMKLEQNPATNIDRISSLPDSLLCHILSFLPTTTSVATCVLSRRWRGLWEHLRVFNFVDKVFETSPGEAPENFVQFVSTVLILRRVRHIQKFSLSCEVTGIHHEVTTWIRGATGQHLQELNISLLAPNTPLGCLLPQSIFTCTALVSLHLDRGICLGQLSSVHLPSLKNLEVDIFCPSAMDMLLCGCPVLETLKLKFQTWPVPSMKMPPSLKRLTFEDVIEDESVEEIQSLEIHTPSLEFLDIIVKGTSCYWFSASNLHNVVEAHLDIYPYYVHVEFVPKLLKELCRTKYLESKRATILCLLRVQPLDFPQFYCLVHLELDIPCSHSRFVIDLLCNCPILQILRIQSMKDIPLSAPWPQPAVGPYCLISHLKECVFGGYQDSTEEQALVAYILERGLVLKTLKIYSDDSMDIRKRHNILKGLSAIPRGSTMCRLMFD